MSTELHEYSTLVNPNRRHKVGVVLSGGGARGAYQAGVMKAVSQIALDAGLENPLPIITGVSAGAVNAAFLASSCHDLELASVQMAKMWSSVTAEQVFRTDALSAGRSGLKLITDATVGAFYKKKLARSLLDTTPLWSFVNKHVDFSRIQSNIDSKRLESLAVTAMNYSNSHSITFVHGQEKAPSWIRSRRLSVASEINVEHVMASAAIPLFFRPVKIAEDHFGDGCLRNLAPLSPAIHLGADRLLVISVRRPDNRAIQDVPSSEPSMARVLGVILNALLLDSMEMDMERMSRINATLNSIPITQQKDLNLRKLDYLWIRPSRDIGHMAGDLFHRLPRVIRYLVGGLGSSREASELTSYLLFDPDFCGELVKMGYEDGMDSADAIRTFLKD